MTTKIFAGGSFEALGDCSKRLECKRPWESFCEDFGNWK
jgi:hypothetical protein